MSKSKTPIAYKRDYDPDENFDRVPFWISQPGGVKTTITDGDHLKLYIQNRVKHSLCFDENGVRTRPDDLFLTPSHVED